jgi:hypothetical protein
MTAIQLEGLFRFESFHLCHSYHPPFGAPTICKCNRWASIKYPLSS